MLVHPSRVLVHPSSVSSPLRVLVHPSSWQHLCRAPLPAPDTPPPHLGAGVKGWSTGPSPSPLSPHYEGNRGDGGPPQGKTTIHGGLTGPPPPSLTNSTSQAAGLNTSRLFSLFEECVEHGVWATIETFRHRGAVCIDFSCRLRNPDEEHGLPIARKPRSRRGRERNIARTKTWEQMRRQSRNSPPTQAAPPASTAVNVPVLAASSPTAARSFADVAAQPATSAAPNTVKAAVKATAGKRGAKAASAHPKKVAKVALAASRVSQRAALLAKKRSAAESPAASPSPSAADEEEAAPEILRGIEGETGLNSTAEISLVASPPPPSSPPSPAPPSPSPLAASPSPQSYSPAATNRRKKCDCVDRNCADCTVECENDYYDERIVDGRRFSTQNPDWAAVFPIRKGLCRFCEKDLPEEDDENCRKCFKKTIFQLVLKFGPRWRYDIV